MQSDLYPQPLDVLREVFGYQSFRSGQDAVIEQLVAGNDVLAIMPTGGGKSLCYQIQLWFVLAWRLWCPR